MADKFIALETQGLEVMAKLQKLPVVVQDAAVDELNKYFINVFRGYPQQKSITREAAYGVTFFTDKQRRWFFANLKEGNIDIPYIRTQALSSGWQQIGTGVRSFIVNERPGGVYVMGDEQSRHEAMVGWKKAADIVKERMERALKVVDGAVKKAIKKLGL